MYTEESKTETRSGTRSASISQNKRVDKNTLRRSTHSNNADLSGRGKRKSRQSVDPFPHVTGSLSEMSLIQVYSRIHSRVNNGVLEKMILLLKDHPMFIDKDWNKNSSHDEFTKFIQDEFNRIFCEKYHVFISFSDEAPEFYWIHALDECETYGNIIPFEWITLLKQKDRTFLELTYHFISICHHRLNIPGWNNYDFSCYLDELACRLGDGDADLEDEYGIENVEEVKEDFSEWEEATRLYHQAIKCSNSLVRFRRLLSRYKPRNKYFKNVVRWYRKAISLIERGISFHKFEYSPLTHDALPGQERYYHNGEAWPSMYCGFTWTFHGYVGEQISNELDETAGNCGIIPLIESQKISQNTMNPVFGNAKKFYDWMSEGNHACRTLLNNLK